MCFPMYVILEPYPTLPIIATNDGLSVPLRLVGVQSFTKNSARRSSKRTVCADISNVECESNLSFFYSIRIPFENRVLHAVEYSFFAEYSMQ